MTGAPPLPRVQVVAFVEVAMKIAGRPPSSGVAEYHMTYVEPTFASAGSSTLSLSSAADGDGPRTGFAASWASGSRVVGRLSVAAGPDPVRARVPTPMGGNVTPWWTTPFAKSPSVSHAVRPGAPFVVKRKPP